MSASFIDLHIDITNKDRIRTIIYDKRIDSNFPIVNILLKHNRDNLWHVHLITVKHSMIPTV
jgi:hypothetical protein